MGGLQFLNLLQVTAFTYLVLVALLHDLLHLGFTALPFLHHLLCDSLLAGSLGFFADHKAQEFGHRSPDDLIVLVNPLLGVFGCMFFQVHDKG